jgi:VIT1/CCC1 family predicted Fe2+/Mn2+ transporter
LPVLVVMVSPEPWLSRLVIGSALVLLVVLGAVAARVGGADARKGALRVAFWGALAMASSALVGRLFGTQVG